jgi:hypothetical protein
MRKRRRRRGRKEQFEYEDRDEGLAYFTKILTVLLLAFLQFVAVLAHGLWDLVCCVWPKRATREKD